MENFKLSLNISAAILNIVFFTLAIVEKSLMWFLIFFLLFMFNVFMAINNIRNER